MPHLPRNGEAMAVQGLFRPLLTQLLTSRRGRDRQIIETPTLKIEVGIRGEVIKLDRLNRRHQQIIARALNAAAMKARTQTRREIARTKGLPQKVLTKRIQAYKASRMKLRASLWVGTRKRIGAQELGGQVSRTAGGQVRVGRRVFRDAFVARMPGGHQGVFTRKPNARHKKRPDGQMSQLPIEEAVVQLMPEAEDISRRAAEDQMRQTFPKEMRRLVRRELELKRL